jgi:acyl carrier protein
MDTMSEHKLRWEQFAAEIAVVAGVEPDAITRNARLLEDLGVDSFALAELVSWLMIDLQMSTLEHELSEREWTQVTVGELFTEYRDEQPPPRRERYLITTRAQR